MLMPEQHDLAKYAKDVAAGAILVFSVHGRVYRVHGAGPASAG